MKKKLCLENDKNEEYGKFLIKVEKMMEVKILAYPRPEELPGTCFSCNEFANILCKNCNIWTCIQHWMDHGVQSHNYPRPETSSTVQQ